MHFHGMHYALLLGMHYALLLLANHIYLTVKGSQSPFFSVGQNMDNYSQNTAFTNSNNEKSGIYSSIIK